MANYAVAPQAAQRAWTPTAEAISASREAALTLTESQRRICERVINVFETGTVEGKYDAISIYHDGPGQIRQITYGRSQTTEYGNLGELVRMYAEANGLFSNDFRPYVTKVGQVALTDNDAFKTLLRKAGREDPVMRRTQDVFFDRVYFQPAQRWARDNGFTRALSMLVIYDSFIHSGSILGFLRRRFNERPPAAGGDEQVWIRDYIAVRHAWLVNHQNPDVRPSNYRTRDLGREIANGNWDLARLPFMANGVAVRDDGGAPTHGIGGSFAPSAFTQLESAELEAFDGDEPVWSEAEPPSQVEMAASRATRSIADIAAEIRDHPNIKLATVHVSGVADQANARQNIEDTAAGRPAKRSSYGNAPGGTVQLDRDMLSCMLDLADTYRFSVSEIAGASHSSNSRHYAGIAFDVNIINGEHVRAGHPDQMAFRNHCRNLGGTEVLGPGVAHHSTHIHAAWPRP